MSQGSGKRRFHFKSPKPNDPQVRRFREWSEENKGFYSSFRQWLFDTGYELTSVGLYGVAARQAIGYLDQPYWVIDPDADIERVWQHIQESPLKDSTKHDYHKGLLKLSEYLRLRQDKPPKEKIIRWDFYLGSLPAWVSNEIHPFLQSCMRSWRPERKHEKTIVALSTLTRPLRFIQAHVPLEEPARLTPERWYEYLDYRLAGGITPQTTNDELHCLLRFLHFVEERGWPVCQRMFLIDKLDEGRRIPRDVPPEQLSRVQQAIQAQAASTHLGQARLGKMDLAWFLLMLHSGLRTCEVRSLRFTDMDWERHCIRIEQSKGLKDRIVFLSQACITALKDYLCVRGCVEALPENVFVFRHIPLSRFYCGQRLHTYGFRCGVHITPHQLRHSCATLLLNCGAPAVSVQALLGHKSIDTTLGYARLYDGTLAADYYRAMALVESRLALPEDRLTQPPVLGQLLALVDSLRSGALTPDQAEVVRILRAGIAALAEKPMNMEDVKVLI